MFIFRSFLFFTIFLLNYSVLQSKDYPMEFGKVSIEERMMTDFDFDPSADAVILCRYGNIGVEETATRYEGEIFLMRRIKVLKETGKSYGDIYIPYYHGNNLERIGNIAAIVTQPDGTTSKLDNKDIFRRKLDENYSAVSFAIPNVKVGSVIDVKYSVTTGNVGELRRWYFQEELPVVHSELDFRPSDYFAYKYFVQGYALADVAPKKSEKYPVEVDINKTNFVLKNLPGMKEEPYLSSLKNYKAHIRFQLSSVRYADGSTKIYLEDWDGFTNSFNTGRFRGDRYKIKKNYKNLWTGFEGSIKAEDSDRQKLIKAYKYVNENIVSNGYISTSSSKTINILLKEKTANSAGLSFAMIALLREMGMEAYPVLIGTRSDGNLILEAPIEDQFNHTLVYVVVDGKGQLLEMGNLDRPVDFLSINALNKFGLLMKDDMCEWIPLKPTLSKSLMMNVLTIEGDYLVGNFKSQFTGYEGLRLEQDFEEGVKNLFENVYAGAEISNYNVEKVSLDNPKNRASLDYKVVLDKVDDLILINPTPFSDFVENPFTAENRYYPIEFTHPFQEKSIFKFEVPDGYVIESLPKSEIGKSPDGQISYEYLVEQSGNTINVLNTLTVNQTEFTVASYDVVKSFFNDFADLIQEAIVLKKTNN